MAAAIANWPDVKATAIATGSLLDAATAHGIPHSAVKMRASREKWPVGRRVLKLAQEAQAAANTQIVKASGGAVTHVTSAAEAMQNTLAERRDRTKLGLSGYVTRMAAQADASGVIEEAPLYKAVADIAGKVWPEQGQQSIRLSIYNQQAPLLDVDMDVEHIESTPSQD